VALALTASAFAPGRFAASALPANSGEKLPMRDWIDSTWFQVVVFIAIIFGGWLLANSGYHLDLDARHGWTIEEDC
jgi:hypothetical protein